MQNQKHDPFSEKNKRPYILLVFLLMAIGIFFAYRTYLGSSQIFPLSPDSTLAPDDPDNIPAYTEISSEINDAIDLWDSAATAQNTVTEEERNSFFSQFDQNEADKFDQFVGKKITRDMSVEISNMDEINETDLANLRELFTSVITRSEKHPDNYDLDAFIALVRLKAYYMRELFQSALLSYDRGEYFTTKNFRVMVTTTSILGYRDTFLTWKEAAVLRAAIENSDFYFKNPGEKAEFSRELIEKKIEESDVALKNIDKVAGVLAEFKSADTKDATE